MRAHAAARSSGPINARLVRGTWLFVALPLLLAAFTIAPASAAAAADTACRHSMGSTAEQLARELARNYPDRAPGSARQPRRRRLGLGAVRRCTTSTHADGHTSTAQIPGRGTVELQNIVAVVARRLSARDRDHRAPRQQRGGARRATTTPPAQAALIELARAFRTRRRARRSSGAADLHARLRLDRRRRVRRPRRSPVSPSSSPYRSNALAVISLDAIAGVPAAAAGDRRRHGAFARGLARPNCSGPRPRADRRRTDRATRRSASCSISASRSRSTSKARSWRAAFRP